MRRVPALVCLLSAAALTSPAAFAQQTFGSILGTVTDASGSVLPNAQVILTNQQTSLERNATTTASGSYSFYNLSIGTYTVRVVRQGFSEAKFPNILIQADRTVTLNARLTVGSVNSTVTVEATPLLNSVDTTNGYVLDSAQIENVPLATGSFTQLAVLAPGVTAELLSGTGTQSGLGNQPIWANGQRDTSNTFLFNGVDTSNLFNGKSTSQVSSGRVVPNTGEGFGAGGAILTGTSVYDAIGQAIPTPAPESIQEIRVNTSMYDAQQGSTSGAHIDMSTKPGTNAIHGQAYLYRGTDWLNAAPFFYKNDTAIPATRRSRSFTASPPAPPSAVPSLRTSSSASSPTTPSASPTSPSGVSTIPSPRPRLATAAPRPSPISSNATTSRTHAITPAQIDPAALAIFNFKLPTAPT